MALRRQSSRDEQDNAHARQLQIIAKWTAAAILAPVIVAILGSLAIDRLHQQPDATEVIFVQPFDFNGKLSSDLHVTKRLRGDCAAGSDGTGNPDADRCFAGHLIYDPCWTAREWNGRVAICPDRPWSNDVVLIQMTAALESDPVPDRTKAGEEPILNELHGPWGLLLENADRCMFVQGAGLPTVAGRRESYTCDHGAAIGVPDRSSKLWTIHFLPSGGHATRTLKVLRAWY